MGSVSFVHAYCMSDLQKLFYPFTNKKNYGSMNVMDSDDDDSIFGEPGDLPPHNIHVQMEGKHRIL